MNEKKVFYFTVMLSHSDVIRYDEIPSFSLFQLYTKINDYTIVNNYLEDFERAGLAGTWAGALGLTVKVVSDFDCSLLMVVNLEETGGSQI